jgi:hypothetical protein
LQQPLGRETIRYGAKDSERQHRDLRDLDAPCGGLGHPPRDLEIDAVGSANGDREIGAPRGRNHFQLFARERMEAVVDRDSRRQGIVTYC